jgi:hypothetical protein
LLGVRQDLLVMVEHPIYFNLVDQFHQHLQQELVLVAVEYYPELVAPVEWEIMEQVQVVVPAALVVVVADFYFHATEVSLLLLEAQAELSQPTLTTKLASGKLDVNLAGTDTTGAQLA